MWRDTIQSEWEARALKPKKHPHESGLYLNSLYLNEMPSFKYSFCIYRTHLIDFFKNIFNYDIKMFLFYRDIWKKYYKNKC